MPELERIFSMNAAFQCKKRSKFDEFCLALAVIELGPVVALSSTIGLKNPCITKMREGFEADCSEF
jgi:hypothetical protein